MNGKLWIVGALAALTIGSCPALALDDEWAAEALPGANGFEPPRIEGAKNASKIEVLDQVQEAFDDAPPEAGIRRFAYSEHLMMKINVRRHMVTRVKLPGEIKEAAVGDAALFGMRHENGNSYLDIWPQVAGVDSNLIVMDEFGRVFTFYVRALPVDSPTVPDMAVLVFDTGIAPLPPKQVEDREAEERKREAVSDAGGIVKGSFEGRGSTGELNPDFLEGIPFDASKVSFDYRMYGDRSIAPDTVFTDGVWTFLYWKPERFDQVDLPVPFKIIDEIDTPANFRMGKTVMAIESIGRLTLKNGQRVVCIEPTEPFAIERETGGQLVGTEKPDEPRAPAQAEGA